MKQSPNKISSADGGRNNQKKKIPFLIHILRFVFLTIGPILPAYAARKAMDLFMTPKRRKGASFSGVFKRAYLLGTPYKNSRITSYMWGEKGKIVVLVHGWESSSRIYESFVIPLLNSGYRVVAIDGPAHGYSKLKQTNLFDFGDALHEVLKSLEKVGEVHALVGHSFGGSSLVNMLCRKGKPEFLKKIVIIASPSRLDKVFTYYFNFMRLPKSIVKQFEIQLNRKFGVGLGDLRVAKWASKLQTDNILVIHDEDDKVIPAREAEILVASGDNFTHRVTKGLGHNRIMKDPEVISNILSYLQEESAVVDGAATKLHEKALQ